MEYVSNKLTWMNKHMVLLQHATVLDTVSEEKYPATTEQYELAKTYPNSEDYVNELVRRKEYKDACCFLAYCLHKRTAVWWAYLCVVDLLTELKKAPHKPRPIEDIGKPKPFNVPEWAKMHEMPKPKDVEAELTKFHDFQKKAWSAHEERMKIVDPEIRRNFEEGLAIVNNEIKKVHGVDIFELFNMAADKLIRSQGNEFIIDIENSPITKAEKELKEKIEKIRTDTIAKVKSALPKIDVKARRQNKRNALDCTYSYIIAPDEDNANICLTIGNKINDTPEGLLALVAFWSFGDLSPKGDIFIKTPPGLMANGLNNLLLMLALAEGGEKTLDERFECYFQIGLEVAIGINNWGKSVEDGKVPHADLIEFEEKMNEAKGTEIKDLKHNLAHAAKEAAEKALHEGKKESSPLINNIMKRFK